MNEEQEHAITPQNRLKRLAKIYLQHLTSEGNPLQEAESNFQLLPSPPVLLLPSSSLCPLSLLRVLIFFLTSKPPSPYHPLSCVFISRHDSSTTNMAISAPFPVSAARPLGEKGSPLVSERNAKKSSKKLFPPGPPIKGVYTYIYEKYVIS